MRKFNAILGIAMTAVFLLHIIIGSLQLSGILPGGSVIMIAATYTLLALVILHTVIGIKLTVDTLISRKRSGAGYFRENRLFWTRRISGFAVILFIVWHIIVFSGRDSDGAFRLVLFDIPQLVGSLLLVLSLAVHIISNIKPLMLALGARSIKEFIGDAAFILSIVLLLAGAAFVIYYTRWLV